MNITVNTDASFCPHTKVGGFAFWIVCDLGRIKVSGALKEAKNSQDSELKCLANAIYTLKKSPFNNGKINKIYINSDCKFMFEKIGQGSQNEIGKYIAKTLQQIFSKNQIIGKTKQGKRYELRHVKAHTGDLSENRNFVNDWCDNEAKNEMRILREKIKNSL